MGSVKQEKDGLEIIPHEDDRIAAMELMFMFGTELIQRAVHNQPMPAEEIMEKISTIQTFLAQALELTEDEIFEASQIVGKENADKARNQAKVMQEMEDMADEGLLNIIDLDALDIQGGGDA
tara:strand:+ start:10247 stop:10612 length:366 start_codon:yes stop_codon:yes gene_type:complete